MALKPGTIFLSKYKILTEIGRGSFGYVYKAREVDTGHTVAIKELRDDLPPEMTEEAEYRFKNERIIGRSFDHPHIVKTYTVEQYQGRNYLVLEYMSGGSLRKMMDSKGPLSVDTAVNITRQICSALSEIHRRDLVHRDISPQNIMFATDGSAKLMDFGLVQEPGGSSGRSWGKGGRHPGTPAYKSPEAETQREYLKPRSDIFMLGAILFEMLTGRKYKNQPEGTPPSQLRPDISARLDTVVLKSLAENGQARYQTAEAFSDALKKIIAQPAQSARPAQPTRPAWLIPVLAIGFVLLLAAGSWGLANSRQPITSTTEPVSVIEATSRPIEPSPLPTHIATETTIQPTSTTISIQATPSPTIAIQAQQPSTVYVEYIIDGSSGMMKPWTQSTEPKLASIQRILPTFWQATATETNNGLRAYGHRYPSTNNQTCTDEELLLPIRQWDSNTLITGLYKIQAQGLDSMSEALRYAFGDFQFKTDRFNAIILLTEGGDTCGGNPLDIIAAHKEIGVQLPIYVIALEPSNNDIPPLESIAQESGGVYYEVYKASDIYNSLTQIEQLLLSQKP